MINRVEHAVSATQSAQVSAASPKAAAVSTRLSAIVELPTIDVRPSAEDMADAARQTDVRMLAAAHSVPVVAHAQLMHTVAPSLPSLGLDMPYYSFGKALPRVSKE
jgi:hypothetical protein